MGSIHESLLLMLVGMLNFLGAILLAHGRSKAEAIELPPVPVSAPRPQTEAAAGI